MKDDLIEIAVTTMNPETEEYAVLLFGPEGDTITEWTPSPDSPQGRRIALVADQLDGALITPEAVEELGIWDATDPSMEALDRTNRWGGGGVSRFFETPLYSRAHCAGRSTDTSNGPGTISIISSGWESGRIFGI